MKFKNLKSDKTLYRIAKDTGLSYTAVKDIFTNKKSNPRIKTLYKILKYLGKKKTVINELIQD